VQRGGKGEERRGGERKNYCSHGEQKAVRGISSLSTKAKELCQWVGFAKVENISQLCS